MPTIVATTFVPAATGSARTSLGPMKKLKSQNTALKHNWGPIKYAILKAFTTLLGLRMWDPWLSHRWTILTFWDQYQYQYNTHTQNSNSNTIPIPIQYQPKLVIFVYDTWIFEFLITRRPLQIGWELK